jgi:hypothetical protein
MNDKRQVTWRQIMASLGRPRLSVIDAFGLIFLAAMFNQDQFVIGILGWIILLLASGVATIAYNDAEQYEP